MKAVILNRILLVLGFLGLFISSFLSIAHVLNAAVPCGRNFGCERVTNDPTYGFFIGVPVAYWGVLGYLLLTVLAALRSIKGLGSMRMLVMPGYFIAAAGALSSLFLQYASLFMIHELCLWCMGSAITMVATLIVYGVLAQSIDEVTEQAAKPDATGTKFTAVLVAVLVLALGGSTVSLKKASSMPVTNITPEQTVGIELVPKDAHIYGDPNAKLTILEFADMYCPACKRTSPKVKEFVDEHPGKVRLVYRHFPLVDKHPLSLPGALMGEAAADKGKFFDFLLAVMKTSGDQDLDAEALYGIARKIGLDDKELRKRMDDSKDPIYARVQRDMKTADQLGLQVTPTLMLMVGDKVKYIASSNDVFDVLQKQPYRDILDGKS